MIIKFKGKKLVAHRSIAIKAKTEQKLHSNIKLSICFTFLKEKKILFSNPIALSFYNDINVYYSETKTQKKRLLRQY